MNTKDFSDQLRDAGATVIETPPGGIYAIVVGLHPFAELWVRSLNLSIGDIPRFRDAWLIEKDGELLINIYARCGSKSWAQTDHHDQWENLKRHPLYVRDYECDHDETYCNMVFSLNPAYIESINELVDACKENALSEWRHPVVDNRSMSEMWDDGNKKMNEALDNESKAGGGPTIDMIKKMFKPLTDAITQNKDGEQ